MAKQKNKQPTQPQWRPNFRNTEKLPDIKVVRTDFLFNSISVTVAVILLLFLGYREYVSATHRARIEELTQQISSMEAQDRANSRKSSTFSTQAKKTDEVGDFIHIPVDPARFLIRLSEIQPQEGRVTSVRFTEYVAASTKRGQAGTLMHRIELTGAMRPDGRRPATQLIDMFQERLRTMELLQPYLSRVQLQSATRDADTDQFTYTIHIELNSPLATK